MQRKFKAGDIARICNTSGIAFQIGALVRVGDCAPNCIGNNYFCKDITTGITQIVGENQLEPLDSTLVSYPSSPSESMARPYVPSHPRFEDVIEAISATGVHDDNGSGCCDVPLIESTKLLTTIKLD